MISDNRRAELIAKAEKLADRLGQFQTPGTGDPVDPSRLAEVMRFVKINGTDDLLELLNLLPGSYLRKASKSAGPQLKEIQGRVGVIAKEVTDPEELAYLLGWARRLMTIAEKKGRRGSAPQDRPGARGGSRRR